MIEDQELVRCAIAAPQEQWLGKPDGPAPIERHHRRPAPL